MILPISQKKPEYTKSKIMQMIADLDTDPLKNSGARVVNSVGDGSSGVFLVGEAPGAKEEKLGEPFVGRAGKFLNNRLLPIVSLTRKNIYLTNIVKCRPPNNRDPLSTEKEAWSTILLAEIAFIKPKVIVCLGRHATNFFLPEVKISQIHGKPKKIQIFKDLETYLLPVYHPAVALYNPRQTETIIQDFKVVTKVLRKYQSRK